MVGQTVAKHPLRMRKAAVPEGCEGDNPTCFMNS